MVLHLCRNVQKYNFMDIKGKFMFTCDWEQGEEEVIGDDC